MDVVDEEREARLERLSRRKKELLQMEIEDCNTVQEMELVDTDKEKRLAKVSKLKHEASKMDCDEPEVDLGTRMMPPPNSPENDIE